MVGAQGGRLELTLVTTSGQKKTRVTAPEHREITLTALPTSLSQSLPVGPGCPGNLRLLELMALCHFVLLMPWRAVPSAETVSSQHPRSAENTCPVEAGGGTGFVLKSPRAHTDIPKSLYEGVISTHVRIAFADWSCPVHIHRGSDPFPVKLRLVVQGFNEQNAWLCGGLNFHSSSLLFNAN